MAWLWSKKTLLFSIVTPAEFTALGRVSFWDLAKDRCSQDVEAAGKRWGWNVSPAWCISSRLTPDPPSLPVIWEWLHLLWLGCYLMLSWILVRGSMTKAMISRSWPSHCESQSSRTFWASVLVSEGNGFESTCPVGATSDPSVALSPLLTSELIGYSWLIGPKSGALRDTKFILTLSIQAALENK